MNITTTPHRQSKAQALRTRWAPPLSACALLAALPSAQALTIDDFHDGSATLEVPAMPLPALGDLQSSVAASVPGGVRTLGLNATAGSSALAFISVAGGAMNAFRLPPQSLSVSFGYGQTAPMNLDLGGQNALRLDVSWGGASTTTGWDDRALEVTVYATTSSGIGLNPHGSAAHAVLGGAAQVDLPFASFSTNSATGVPVNWADVDGLLFVVSERNPGASAAGFGLSAVSAVPEPAAWLLWSAALALAAAGRSRRSARTPASCRPPPVSASAAALAVRGS